MRYQPSEKDVDEAVEKALGSAKNYDFEIAFFGGSFTAIDRSYMERLLRAAYKYVENNTVRGIRLSTRPDAIDSDVLETLKKYGVTSIELGAQSMSDEVLEANRRGHTAGDVKNASVLIKSFGFSLGLQMMTGLYGSDFEKDVFTAKEIIKLKPDTVRIYPTVTIENTRLAQLYRSGEYKPCGLNESVNLCALLLKMFLENNIEVIRLGLHYSEELERQMLFNNYHPAFRELCESKIMLDEFLRCVDTGGIKKGSTAEVFVNPRSVSKVVGQNRENIKKINELGFDIRIRQDKSKAPYEIGVLGDVNAEK